MKKETVGSGGTQPDEFDLDSFLRENRFFSDETDLADKVPQQNIASQTEATSQKDEAPGDLPARRHQRLVQTVELQPQDSVPAGNQKTAAPEDTGPVKPSLSQIRQERSIQAEATQEQAVLTAATQEIVEPATVYKKEGIKKEVAQRDAVQKDADLKDDIQKGADLKDVIKKGAAQKDLIQKKLFPKKSSEQSASPETTGFTVQDEMIPIQKEDIQKKNGKPIQEELQLREVPGGKKGTKKSMDPQDERVPTRSARPGVRKDVLSTVSASPGTKKPIDTNSTVSYQSLGEELPGIPLVSGKAQHADELRLDDPDFDFLERLTTDYTKDFDEIGGPGSTGSAKTKATGTDKKIRAGMPGGASNRDRVASNPRSADKNQTVLLQSSETTRKQDSPKQDRKAAPQASEKDAARLSTYANPRDFQQARMQDNSYRIRGGGKRHNKRTPVMMIVITIVIVIGMVIAGFFLKDLYDRLTGQKPTETVVRLTTAQTRAAIDAEMPVMFNYLYWNINDIHKSFVEAGWNVANNERRAVENPDKSAKGGEIIHLAPDIPLEILEGYYQSEFNIYDYDELQDSFNGAWILSVSHGNQGSYAQIKYVNFASTSLNDELLHLAEMQGLLVESSVIDARGIDGYGNSFMQGFVDINDKIYYWKAIGIEFSDYYRGQDRRKLPDTAVFVKCIISDFDFYGVNKTLLDSYLKQKEEAAGNSE